MLGARTETGCPAPEVIYIPAQLEAPGLHGLTTAFVPLLRRQATFKAAKKIPKLLRRVER